MARAHLGPLHTCKFVGGGLRPRPVLAAACPLTAVPWTVLPGWTWPARGEDVEELEERVRSGSGRSGEEGPVS